MSLDPNNSKDREVMIRLWNAGARGESPKEYEKRIIRGILGPLINLKIDQLEDAGRFQNLSKKEKDELILKVIQEIRNRTNNLSADELLEKKEGLREEVLALSL